MKKTFTMMAAMALCASANAQSLRFIELDGQVGVTVPGLMVESISPNGKYVCGTLQYGMGYFVGNVETDPFDIIWAPTEDDYGAELRHINNAGVAIGYDGPGITMNMEGVKTELQVPSSSYQYVLGEDISDDGSVMVGSLCDGSFITFPAYSRDGGTWTLLPIPPEEDRGMWVHHGFTAKFVSGDGKVILGGFADLGPAILWVMDENGEYKMDPLCMKYATMELDQPDAEFGFFRASGVSPNGRYVLITASLNDGRGGFVPVVYDVETQEITQYDEIYTLQGYEIGLTPTAIADDGTFIGVVGAPELNLGGFIMKAGEYESELLAEAYPEFAADFGIMDMLTYHVPTGISADGRYIVGAAWYSPEFKNPDADQSKIESYFTSYILDRGDISGVKGVETEATASASAEYYTLDGVKVTDPRGGIFIRVKDGKASKVAIR